MTRNKIDKTKLKLLKSYIKKGDRIGVTHNGCHKRKRVITFDHWEGPWLISKSYALSEYFAGNIYSINGEKVKIDIFDGNDKFILPFQLPSVFIPTWMNSVNNMFYKDTGCKLSISFDGSKGYLSHVRFECEGSQKYNNNRIFFRQFIDNQMIDTDPEQTIKMYHSDRYGIRLEYPQQEHKEDRSLSTQVIKFTDLDDLPF